MLKRLENFVEGTWQASRAVEALKVLNPASGQVLAEVPLSPAEEVGAAAAAAQKAFEGWRRTPAGERIQPLFRLKTLLEENLNDFARTVTDECGKTFAESVGELRRAIENVEVACGIPSLMQGSNSEDIAAGIDEHMIRQPLGVVAAITPFNFPAMIPFWFMPYALATALTPCPSPKGRGETIQTRSDDPPSLIETPLHNQEGCKANTGDQGDGQRPAGPSRHSGDQLCGLHPNRTLHLQPRRGQRQARPVSGRSQEPGGGPAGCRYGYGGQNHRRFGFRLRGPALSRRFVGSDGGRGAQPVQRSDLRCGGQPQSGLRPR